MQMLRILTEACLPHWRGAINQMLFQSALNAKTLVYLCSECYLHIVEHFFFLSAVEFRTWICLTPCLPVFPPPASFLRLSDSAFTHMILSAFNAALSSFCRKISPLETTPVFSFIHREKQNTNTAVWGISSANLPLQFRRKTIKNRKSTPRLKANKHNSTLISFVSSSCGIN